MSSVDEKKDRYQKYIKTIERCSKNWRKNNKDRVNANARRYYKENKEYREKRKVNYLLKAEAKKEEKRKFEERYDVTDSFEV